MADFFFQSAFLHFSELDTIPYMLYHFQKRGRPPGHTAYSWAAKGGAAPRPIGHTDFSWPSL